MMIDDELEQDEFKILNDDGYRYAGGGLNPDNSIYLKFMRNGETAQGSRTYWRAVIAELSKPLTEDEIAFGKDAWVYCNQHLKAHETGWCTVGPRDKVGLGVKTAQEAYEKCREWGFKLYRDLYPNG